MTKHSLGFWLKAATLAGMATLAVACSPIQGTQYDQPRTQQTPAVATVSADFHSCVRSINANLDPAIRYDGQGHAYFEFNQAYLQPSLRYYPAANLLWNAGGNNKLSNGGYNNFDQVAGVVNCIKTHQPQLMQPASKLVP